MANNLDKGQSIIVVMKLNEILSYCMKSLRENHITTYHCTHFFVIGFYFSRELHLLRNMIQQKISYKLYIGDGQKLDFYVNFTPKRPGAAYKVFQSLPLVHLTPSPPSSAVYS